MKKAIKQTWKSIKMSLPLIFGTLLLVSLITVLVPPDFYLSIFKGNTFLDPLIGSIIGSISAGNPITSYVLGGELLIQGISLLAVTAFLVAWVTVGMVQLPAESALLGKKFAIVRNITAFLLAILTAIITIYLMGLF
ncbi:MAG: hypothetical protein U9R08_06460 [Nanoarchaeota archaeon]|nr:hypothetical protein [Nanoarchaeota archaeon]